MILDDLFLDGIGKVLEAGLLLLQVDVAEAAIKENLAGIELEHETQLRIVNHIIPAQVEQSIVEVGQSFLKVADEKVGHALLEVGDGEILIEAHGALIALDGLFMLAQRRVNDTAVEEDLGGICDVVEFLEGIVKGVVVVVGECGDPSLDFLEIFSMLEMVMVKVKVKLFTNLLERHLVNLVNLEEEKVRDEAVEMWMFEERIRDLENPGSEVFEGDCHTMRNDQSSGGIYI